MSAVTVRTLKQNDAVAVRDLRLEALHLFPASFRSSSEEDAMLPLAFWEKRLCGPTRTLRAESKGRVVGIVSVSENSRVKLAHTAEIVGLYVTSSQHRQGVGKGLMQSVMELLRSNEFPTQVNFATLTVVANNQAARGLYESFGFTVCGKFDQNLSVDGMFYDELFMRARIS